MPKTLEFSEVAGFHLVNSYDKLNATVIHESVATGFNRNSDLAALKSLVEFFERRAFDEGFRRQDPACLTERSDGFAAYPVIGDVNKGKEKARENAYAEAIERLAWANWWDNESVAFEAYPTSNFPEISAVQSDVHKRIPISEAVIVAPKLEEKDFEVLILVFFLKDGGVISGGAGGKVGMRTETLQRASAEILRHALAVQRMRESGFKPQSFYERRLFFFATNDGEALVRSRLRKQGAESVALPPLKIDSEVCYSNSDLIYVHRCLFENQPPFVGGHLERFCL